MNEQPNPVFDAPPGDPTTCQRCGRIFEGPRAFTDADGKKVRLAGHVQGDPQSCLADTGPLRGTERDARVRRASRRGC